MNNLCVSSVLIFFWPDDNVGDRGWWFWSEWGFRDLPKDVPEEYVLLQPKAYSMEGMLGAKSSEQEHAKTHMSCDHKFTYPGRIWKMRTIL